MTHRTWRALALVIFLICVLDIPVDWRASRSLGQTRGTNSVADWRPGQDTNGIRYVGTSKCVQCHSTEAATQPATPIGHALALVADCQILSSRPLLTFRIGSYTYRITRVGNRSIYSVSDGVNTVSEPILYCFGQGKVGQTYSFRHNGSFYESRISYYSGVDGLDFTIGQRRSIPTSLEESFCSEAAPAETGSCFGCHSTGAVNGS